MGILITEEDHRKKHIELHRSLDVLLADFIINNEGGFMDRPIQDLISWSHKQTTELDHELKPG